MWTMAVWQGLQNDSISAGNTRLLMIFVGIVAFAMLSQSFAIIIMAIGAKRTQAKLLVIAEELRAKASPLLDTTEVFFKDSMPKIKSISENLLQTSIVVRAKAQELDVTLTDVNKKTRAQVARIDGMVSTALTATGSLAAMLHQGIRIPLIEAVGVVNGFKAGIDVFMKKGKRSNSASPSRTAMTVYKSEEDAG